MLEVRDFFVGEVWNGALDRIEAYLRREAGCPVKPAGRARHPRPVIVAATVGAAVVVNLVVYAAGRAAGADFTFTSAGTVTQVDALTVVGFTVVPLLLGLTVVARPAGGGGWSRPWRWSWPRCWRW